MESKEFLETVDNFEEFSKSIDWDIERFYDEVSEDLVSDIVWPRFWQWRSDISFRLKEDYDFYLDEVPEEDIEDVLVRGFLDEWQYYCEEILHESGEDYPTPETLWKAYDRYMNKMESCFIRYFLSY